MDLVHNGKDAKAPPTNSLFQYDTASGCLLVLSPANLVLAKLTPFDVLNIAHVFLGLQLARAAGQQVPPMAEIRTPVVDPVAETDRAHRAETIGAQALAALAAIAYLDSDGIWSCGQIDGTPLMDVSPELSAALHAYQAAHK